MVLISGCLASNSSVCCRYQKAFFASKLAALVLRFALATSSAFSCFSILFWPSNSDTLERLPSSFQPITTIITNRTTTPAISAQIFAFWLSGFRYRTGLITWFRFLPPVEILSGCPNTFWPPLREVRPAQDCS